MKRLAYHLINIALILAFIFGVYYVYQLSHKKKPEDLYRLQPVTMGDIEQNVTAQIGLFLVSFDEMLFRSCQ